MRAEIEAAFDMDATDIYGLSEVIGPGVAQECVETKDGLHVWEDHFYPEVIDPETGAVLPDGEKGELVFTSLTKEAFPIIRYRTRDLTRLLPGTARPGMRRMEKVTGRSDDMIILRGVNVFPTQIEEVLLATDWCGGHFIIELTREGRMDEMTVLAEARPEHWDGSGLVEHTERVTAYIKNTIGISARDPGGSAGNAGALARQGKTGVRQATEGIASDHCRSGGVHDRQSLTPRYPDIIDRPRRRCCGGPFPRTCEFSNGRFRFTHRRRDRRRDPRQEDDRHRARCVPPSHAPSNSRISTRFIILNKDGALAAAAQVDKGEPDRARSPVCRSWSRTTSIPPTCRPPPARRRCRTHGRRQQRAVAAEAARCRRHRDRQDQHARARIRHHQHQSVAVRGPGEKSL